MTRKYYDRYQRFEVNNQAKTVPFINIDKRPTDITQVYKKNTRLDIISSNVYGSPYYGWIILQANPKFGGLEFNIPEGTELRVPFPLESVLQEYQTKLNRFNTLYGI